MKTHFKSGMNKVKSNPENLDHIMKKLNDSNSKETNLFIKFKRKYAVIAFGLTIILVFTSLVFFNDQDSETSGETEVTQVEKTTEEVYMTLAPTSENIYVAEVSNYETFKEITDFVFTFRPIEKLYSYCTNGRIYTVYSVEVTTPIKGEVSGTIPLSVPGGSITVEEYYNSIDPDAATKQFPNGIEHISDQLVVADPSTSVPLIIGNEYLAFSYYNEIENTYTISADSYGVYEIENDIATNKYSGQSVAKEDW